MTPPARFALAWRIARRELRGDIRGSGVFLVCLFLGVFAVSAVGSFSQAARSGILSEARSLMGGDVEIRLAQREISEAQRGYIEGRARISTVVEMRAMARPILKKTGGATAALVEMKAVDHAYPFYGRIALIPDQPLSTALALSDGAYGAAVEEVLLKRLGLAIGDRLAVGRAQYVIRAVIASEPDRTIQAFALGPRLMVSTEGLAETGLLAPGGLASYAYRLRLPGAFTDSAAANAFIAGLNKRFPEAGWRVRDYEKAAPRVRYFLDRMTVNLTLVGLCTLLVGGLGVAAAVRGYLAGKTLHIAAMKCLGATSGDVFSAYLIQVLILASMGVGAGLAAGATVPYAAVWFFKESLPVPVRPGLFPEPLAVAAVLGLLVALAFSLAPLGAACRVPPAVLFRSHAGASGAGEKGRPTAGVAIAVSITIALLAAVVVATSGEPRLAMWFVAGVAACILLFRTLAAGIVLAAKKAPPPRDPCLRLGIGNIHRPGSPAASAVFSLGLSFTALVTVALVQANLSSLVDKGLPEEAPSFFFIDIQPDQTAAFDRVVRSVPGVSRVERVPTLSGRITRIGEVPAEKAKIASDVAWAVRGDRFLTFAARPPEGARIVAGEWWPEAYAGPPLISLTSDLAEGFGVRVGDTLTVNILGRGIDAEIANLRDVDWSTLALNFAVIFAPGVLEDLPQTHIATVYAPPGEEEAVFNAVTSRFPNVSAIRIKEVLQNVSHLLARIGSAFRGMAAVAVLTGLLVLAGAIAADQHRRIYDAVVFKVCGATRWDILKAFSAEFATLGLAAGVISALAGSAAAYAVVERIMHSEFAFEPVVVLVTVLAGLAFTLTLGLAGTARALTRKPAPYLRDE